MLHWPQDAPHRGTVQDTTNLLFAAELPYRQSADLCVAKHSNVGSVEVHEGSVDTSQRVRRHLMKSLRILHEESAELPKDLRIKGREFE